MASPPDEPRYSNRTIPRISLADFDARLPAITAAVVHAAETDGFFVITDHGIPPAAVEAQFRAAERFFALPDETKARVPFSPRNTGWEKRGQIRPSGKGRPDQKESYQMQFGANMDGAWLPEGDIPGFREQSLAFMHRCQAVSEMLMRCLARELGFPEHKFVEAHDVSQPNAQTVLRALHYFELDPAEPIPEGYCRAGEHADWDLLTLLFQRPGQSGLEICPGREVYTKYGRGDTWTKVEPTEGDIVCNIGDLLMSWSDDRFKSTLHRVKTPTDPASDFFGARYSLAYFNQPCSDCEIQGPLKKYPLVTGAEFTRAAMRRNYEALTASMSGNKEANRRDNEAVS